MPIACRCPSCERPLRVPDHLLGRKVRCPGCQQMFVVETAAPAPAPPLQEGIAAAPRTPWQLSHEEQQEYATDETEEDREYRRPRRRRGGRADWAKVRIGITLNLVAVGVFLLAVLALFLGGMVVGMANARSRPEDMAEQLLIPVIIGAGLGIGATLLSIAGDAFCLAAPPKHGAQGLAIASLVLGLVPLAVFPVGLFVPPVRALGNLSHLAQTFVFLFFLRAVARCLRAGDMESNVNRLIVLLGVTIGGYLVITVAAFVGVAIRHTGATIADSASLTGASLVMVCGGCVELILGLVTFILYVLTLIEARNQIGDYLDRRA